MFFSLRTIVEKKNFYSTECVIDISGQIGTGLTFVRYEQILLPICAIVFDGKKKKYPLYPSMISTLNRIIPTCGAGGKKLVENIIDSVTQKDIVEGLNKLNGGDFIPVIDLFGALLDNHNDGVSGTFEEKKVWLTERAYWQRVIGKVHSIFSVRLASNEENVRVAVEIFFVKIDKRFRYK